MLLLVHPIDFFFFFFGLWRKTFGEEKKNQKAFAVRIYIMNKDEERKMCKSDSMQAVAYVV